MCAGQNEYQGGEAAKRDIPDIAAEYFGLWNKAPGGPPAYGLYARNVKGLTLQNVRFEYEQPDARPAIVFDNVQDASVTGLSAQGNPAMEMLRLENSKDVLFTASRVLTPAAAFLRVEGATSEGIFVDGGDLRKANKQIVLADGAMEKSVVVRAGV